MRDHDADAMASPLIADVVSPAVAEAERAFSGALSRVNVDDLARRVEIGGRRTDSAEIDFTI